MGETMLRLFEKVLMVVLFFSVPIFVQAQIVEEKEKTLKKEKSSGSVEIRRGYRADAELETVSPDENGIIQLEMRELDRIEVHLLETTSKGQIQGFHLVGSDRRPLPIGSTLDKEKGIFYWALGPGFLGAFDFVFWSNADVAGGEKIRIRIHVVSQYPAKPKKPKS